MIAIIAAHAHQTFPLWVQIPVIGIGCTLASGGLLMVWEIILAEPKI
jgi:hypothetical protein